VMMCAAVTDSCNVVMCAAVTDSCNVMMCAAVTGMFWYRVGGGRTEM